ncbi:MAG: LysR family transcriptional regulator [Atopobiaceae bacterium]
MAAIDEVNLRQIEMFLAVARAGSMTGAARKLFVSQTAVTKQMQLLEEELGVALFARGHHIALTDAGVYFQKEAEAVWDRYVLLCQNMEAWREGAAGTLEVGIMTYIDPTLVVELFRGFRERYPDVRCHFHTMQSGAIADEIQNGTLDLGIGVARPGIESFELRRYSLMEFCASGKDPDKLPVIVDMRTPELERPPIEDTMVEVELGEGKAVLHGFMTRFDEGLCVHELSDTSAVSLLFDEHFSRTKERFLAYAKEWQEAQTA